MKSLVVYDSAYGNTKKVGEKIAEGLGAKAVKVSEFKKEDLNDIRLLVVGSPINGWNPLPSIKAFVDSLPDLREVKASSFDTRVKLFIHGDAMNKIANSLTQKGAKIISKPMAFYVKGQEGPLFEEELEKALKWGEELKKENS